MLGIKLHIEHTEIVYPLIFLFRPTLFIINRLNMIQVSWGLFFWGCFIWILTEVFLRPDAFPSKVWHQTLTLEDVLKRTTYWSLRAHLWCDWYDNQEVWLWLPVDMYQCSASTYLSQGKTHLLRLWLAYPKILLIIWYVTKRFSSVVAKFLLEE